MVDGHLLVNAKEAAAGRVALALALPTGRTFAAGVRQVLQARFTALPTAAGSRTDITFGHQLVTREISDALANPLDVNYVNGSVLITAANSALRLQALQRLASGAIRLFAGTQDGSPVDPARLPKIQLRASASLAVPIANWSPLTSAPVLVNGVVRFDDFPPPNQRQRFYAVVEYP